MSFAVDMKIIEFVFYETLAGWVTKKFMQELHQSHNYRRGFFEASIGSDDLQRGCAATSTDRDSKIELKERMICKLIRPLIKITKGLI